MSSTCGIRLVCERCSATLAIRGETAQLLEKFVNYLWSEGLMIVDIPRHARSVSSPQQFLGLLKSCRGNYRALWGILST